MISIKGLDKAKVLRALFNASHQQGMGFVHSNGARPMGDADAEQVFKQYAEAGQTYFDYVRGRVLKVDLGSDTFDPRLFDRDCGEGAAERAIAALRAASGEAPAAPKGNSP